MFSEIINPFLYVRNKVKRFDGTWVDQKETREVLNSRSVFNVTVTPDSQYTVFERWGSPITLVDFEMGTNNDQYDVKLYHNTDQSSSYTNNLFHVVNAGSGRSLGSPGNILTEGRGSEHLKVDFIDDTSKDTKISTKKEIYLPQGCALIVENQGTTDLEITFKAIWREVEGYA